jgi:hypothetical protein
MLHETAAVKGMAARHGSRGDAALGVNLRSAAGSQFEITLASDDEEGRAMEKAAAGRRTPGLTPNV